MGAPIQETSAAVFNPVILHKSVLKYRMPKTIARNIFDTRYEDVKIGDNIDIPKLTRITVGTISLGTAFKDTTYRNPTEVKATVAIDQWSYGARSRSLRGRCGRSGLGSPVPPVRNRHRNGEDRR
jgi:hypothetical protein